MCLEETVGINRVLACASGFLLSGDTRSALRQALLLPPRPPPPRLPLLASPPRLPLGFRPSCTSWARESRFFDTSDFSSLFSVLFCKKREKILPQVFIHLLAPCLVRLCCCFGFGPAVVPSLSLSGLPSSPVGKASSVSHLPGCVENSAQAEGLGWRRSGPCT